MSSFTIRRKEGESDDAYRKRLNEHLEKVQRAEEELRETLRKIDEKWGKH